MIESKSSALRITAARRPCLVTSIRSWVRTASSTSLERLARTLASGSVDMYRILARSDVRGGDHHGQPLVWSHHRRHRVQGPVNLLSVETELVAFDVLHHDAGLFAVARRQ